MEPLKRYLPHILIIAGFVAIAYLFTPQVFQGKVVNQQDIASWRGMANEIITYNEANPDKDPALWTNSMFSGMPATTISVKYQGDYTDYLYNLLFLGERPPSYLILTLVGAFLMFLAFGVNVWLAAIGAVAVAFCSYNFQIIQVGHNSKMVAIAFMPWVIAAVTYAYRKKALLGGVLFALALGFQIKANHPQITYYLAMIILFFALSEMISAIKEKRFPRFLTTSLWMLVAGGIGIATNINHLWPTYEYSKYTMRGGSELREESQATEKNQGGKRESGLDIAYATQWSYSPSETPNLLIPNFNGGSSAGELSKESQTYKFLKQNGYPGADQIIKHMPLYWGPQPFTAGPMYMGAISLFLFFLGLFLLKGAEEWWIVAVTLLALLLSWGSNLMFLTELFFKYAPMYSKFRTVSMILVILQITIPLLGFMTLRNILEGGVEKKQLKKGVIVSLCITAGFALIMLLIPSLAGSFTGAADNQLPSELKSILAGDRISLLRSDSIRTIIYILLAASLLWLTYIRKLKKEYFYVFLALIVVADLWSAGKRYLNDSHFIAHRSFVNQYQKRPVDEMILRDKDPNYRVLDLSVTTFNDSHVSYHHKTIGGYSPAKLQRYQDIIDIHLTKEMSRILEDIGGSKTVEEAQSKLGTYSVLNMLNTKYLIVGGENPPLVNDKAMGNCWFADSLLWVSSATEEILKTGESDLTKVAVVSKQFEKELPGIQMQTKTERIEADGTTTAAVPGGPSGSIILTHYSPNELKYKSVSDRERIAVFSEIYYPAGWSAYIDDQPSEIFRANYILRALKIPAGEHGIRFVYRPASFVKGAQYSRISSGLLILLLLSAISYEVTMALRGKSKKSLKTKKS
ncbi:MAG: YfhO family protein [Bacteroidales bacterium]|nr:YfhO family protein [Bacteroidales bacterium]